MTNIDIGLRFPLRLFRSNEHTGQKSNQQQRRSFIYLYRKSNPGAFDVGFRLHLCTCVLRIIFPTMHSFVANDTICYGAVVGGRGGRREMAAPLLSTQHDQNIVLSLIMLFIIVSPLILSSFNINSRVIDSGRAAEQQIIWRLMGSFSNYWIWNIWVHVVSIGC